MANPHSALIREWEEAKAKGIPMSYVFRWKGKGGKWHAPLSTEEMKRSYTESEVDAGRWASGHDPAWHEEIEYRIRPIPLRQIEVILKHEPMTRAPKRAGEYYIACPIDTVKNDADPVYWTGTKFERRLLAAGLCYATAEGAIERGWAMRRTGRG